MGIESIIMHAIPDPPVPVPVRPAQCFARGLLGALSVPGFVLVATFVGFGGLLHDLSFPLGAGLLSTLLVWALPAQVILIGGLAAGAPLPALAVAVCLSGVRLMPMVVSLMPLMRGPRPRLSTELLCAHFVAVTLWVEGFRLLPKVAPEGRPAYACGLGSGLIALSMAGTAIGFYLTHTLPGPFAIALLLLTPISFTILLVRNAREPVDWLAIVLGAGMSPLAVNAPGGLDLFWAGVGGGTLAFLIARYMPRRRT
ncbi:MAG: AzlC family protein [Xanthobacteraceae bacterium]|jgi:predicted branched-subunit amino acid permease|nr:AzlC family protein [Xanthobacteraceae bacterium]